MQVNRGLVFWGVALITAGAVALTVQSGTLDESVAREAWRWWPVVLIVIGLAVIAARTPFALATTAAAGLVVGGLAGTLVAGWPSGIGIGCGGEPTEVTSEEGSFSGAADVRLRLNCGELHVTTTPGSAWSVEAGHPEDAAPEISHDDGSLVVSAGDSDGFIGLERARHAWDVTLPAASAIDLEIDVNAGTSRLDLADADLTRFRMSANAGEVRLDLGGARVTDLSIDANAGSVSVATDASTMVDGSIGMNAGSLELCVPDGPGVEIVLDDPNVTFSHNLDGAGFTRDRDSWRLGDGSAIRLEIDGNAASFTFNPDGGCS